MDGAPARGLPPRAPDKVEVPPARSPSSPSARCVGAGWRPAAGPRPTRSRPTRRGPPPTSTSRAPGRRAGTRCLPAGQPSRGRPAGSPALGAMPPPACRAAMAAGRSPPAMGRSGVQTTPRSTATTQTALHRCRLSAAHRRCGRRRWADVSVDGRAPVGGKITYADCGKVSKTLGSLWFVYTVCIGGTCGRPSRRHGTGAAWRWVYGRAVTVCPR